MSLRLFSDQCVPNEMNPETIPYLMAGLLRYLADHPDQLFYRGKLLLVEPHRIRVRE